jgi:hypothetical protein
VAGAIIGAAGTVYATNKEVRKKLPGAVRELPENLRYRFREAVSAGREASSARRTEILRDLRRHGGEHHASRGVEPIPDVETSPSVPDVGEE